MEITDELIDFNLNFMKSEYDKGGFVTETDFVELDGITSMRPELIARELDNNDLLEAFESAYLLSKHAKYVLSVGGWLRYLELENEQLKDELEEQSIQSNESAELRRIELENARLTTESLKLNNDKLKYEKTLRLKNEEIIRLKTINLRIKIGVFIASTVSGLIGVLFSEEFIGFLLNIRLLIQELIQ